MYLATFLAADHLQNSLLLSKYFNIYDWEGGIVALNGFQMTHTILHSCILYWG